MYQHFFCLSHYICDIIIPIFRELYYIIIIVSNCTHSYTVNLYIAALQECSRNCHSNAVVETSKTVKLQLQIAIYNYNIIYSIWSYL
ncbi:hypothetical protein MtrunA17_Chr6g0455541 [Medicago truncatula]|uniref:Uncharacterized protein n=1 Tax=Medicago truncatula TaxID=3880 RepID=A0A396HCH1_MEDTR|nr:hypothetical protein MtrunA17_Chr6g0455541 [Medicago truncatula]